MTVEELIPALAKTSSAIEKSTILSKTLWNVDGSANQFLVDVFYLALNPHILYYRTSAAVPWELAQGKDSLENHWNDIYLALLNVSERKVTKDAEIKAMFTPILRSLSSGAASILRCIINKDLRCGVAAKTINKVMKKELIPEDAVQLANKVDEKTIATDTMWFVSPKLDGVRAYYDATPDWLRSRQGKSFYGLDKLSEYCKAITETFHLSFLDGELLVPDGEGFSTTESIVSLTPKSKTHSAEEIKAMKDSVCYCVFACGQAKQFKDTSAMVETLMNIEGWLSKEPLEGIKDRILILPQTNMITPSMDEVYRVTKEFVADGFEGSMWRSQKTPYDYKRSNALLKFKFMHEAILTVVDTFPGKGKFERLAGGIVCEGRVEVPCKNGQQKDVYPIKVNVGSGFDDETRKTIDKSWIGREVCIYYQDMTQDKDEAKKGKDGVYSLRFPVFHGFEDDRL